jgi:hypothetical protein
MLNEDEGSLEVKLLPVKLGRDSPVQGHHKTLIENSTTIVFVKWIPKE